MSEKIFDKTRKATYTVTAAIHFSKERKECMDGGPSYQKDNSNSRKYWPAQAGKEGTAFVHCVSEML